MYDDNAEYIKYSYFNTKEIEEVISGTYAVKDADVEYKTVTWNHGMSEIFSALLEQRIAIKSFQEYDYSLYETFARYRAKVS